MEVSHVRNRLRQAIETSRERGQKRRQQVSDAERAYASFVENTATPVMRMLTNALKVEGYAFTLFTPGGGVRLASDRGRNDYIELGLDATAAPPQVVARISRTRGSRTLDEERPINGGASPDSITEDDLLAFLLDALEPWLER
jgi:hypothetical protein